MSLKDIKLYERNKSQKVTFLLHNVLEKAKLQGTDQWLPGLGSWYYYKGLV